MGDKLLSSVTPHTLDQEQSSLLKTQLKHLILSKESFKYLAWQSGRQSGQRVNHQFHSVSITLGMWFIQHKRETCIQHLFCAWHGNRLWFQELTVYHAVFASAEFLKEEAGWYLTLDAQGQVLHATAFGRCPLTPLHELQSELQWSRGYTHKHTETHNPFVQISATPISREMI